MKFITIIKDRLKSITRAVIRFPLVFLFLCTLAVLASMSIETQQDFTREVFALIVGVFLSAAMQIRFENSDKPRLRFLVSQALVIGLAASYYWGALYQYDGGVTSMLRTLVLSFALLIVFLWLPSVRWKTNFNEVFMSFWKAVFTAGFFTLVIWGGIMLILGAVNSLLFRLPDNLYSHVAVWSWIAVAPVLFLSLIPIFGGSDKDKARQEHLSSIPTFFRLLLSYVLLPLAAIYTLVLIAYLIKTLVSGDPDNLLEPLILSYSIAVILLYILVSGIENKIAVFYRLVFPKIMAVIALYQVFVSCMRIPQEGITYGRYFVILFGIFSVVSGVLMSVLPRGKNWIIAVVLTGFAIVSIVPPADAFSVGARSQAQVLERVLISNQMITDKEIISNEAIADKDKETITRTVQYLYDVKDLDRIKQIPEPFEMYSDFEQIFGFAPFYVYSNVDNPETISQYFALDSSKPIEIGTYEYLVSVNASKNNYNPQDMPAAKFTDQGKEYEVVILTKGDQFDLQLQDVNGQVLLSASLADMIDSISGGSGSEGKEMVPPEDMTFDVQGNNASIRIVFQFASSYMDNSQLMYDTNMYLLVKID